MKVGRTRTRSASCAREEGVVMRQAGYYAKDFNHLLDAHLSILFQEMFSSKYSGPKGFRNYYVKPYCVVCYRRHSQGEVKLYCSNTWYDPYIVPWVWSLNSRPSSSWSSRVAFFFLYDNYFCTLSWNYFVVLYHFLMNYDVYFCIKRQICGAPAATFDAPHMCCSIQK